MNTVSAVVAVLLLPAALLLASLDSDDPEPSPDLSASEVVQIQVEALRANDEPYADAGIQTAFRFASPSNRSMTGPIQRFAAMVKGPTYSDMLDFARVEYGRIAVDGDRAAQRVTLYHADGRRASYVFALTRQSGGTYDGCWMTDGVVRRPLSESTPTRI